MSTISGITFNRPIDTLSYRTKVLHAKKHDKKIIGHKEVPLSPEMVAWLKNNPDELDKVAKVLREVDLERLTFKTLIFGTAIAGGIERLGFHGAFLHLLNKVSPELITNTLLKAHDPVVYTITGLVLALTFARFYYKTHNEGSKELKALDELALKMREDASVQSTLIDFLQEQGTLRDANWMNKFFQMIGLQQKTQHTLEKVFEDRKLYGWFKQEIAILEPYLVQLQKELKQEAQLKQPQPQKKKSRFRFW